MNTEQILQKELLNAWSRQITKPVFLAPILGPVYIKNKSPKKLLLSILKNANSKSFLSFDKNKRWFKKKSEFIILSETVLKKHGIYLVSRDNFFKSIKVYYYSKNSPNQDNYDEAIRIAKSTNEKIKCNQIVLYFFKKPKFKKNFTTHNIYLKNITKNDQIVFKDNCIYLYSDLNKTEQKSFSIFKNYAEHDGLNFIWQNYLDRNIKLNPIICCLRNKKIIGAIGPLDTAIDAYGQTFLQAPFFGVLGNHKRLGNGKNLWLSAMDFAQKIGAKYTLVQNTPESSAGNFYKKQGLKISNQVFSCRININ